MTFVAPSTGGDYIKVADLDGHLVLITPHQMKLDVETSMGASDAIECDVVDLDTNEEHLAMLFFNKALITALRPNIGAQVLGRIGKGTAKAGKSAPWILLDATSNPADVKKATDWLVAKASGTIAAPAAATPAPAPAPADALNDPAVQALLAQLAAKQ